ncbi:IDEAL domain-containing protein [Bacillus sp. AK031]
MSSSKRDKVGIGDWVRGFAKNGALIQGYMENIDPLDPLFKIRVIESDDKDLIGYSLNMDDSLIERMPDNKSITEAQLEYLIDIALQTKDKQWFFKLTNALKGVNGSSGNKDSASIKEYSIKR